jgi:hypothetical protein
MAHGPPVAAAASGVVRGVGEGHMDFEDPQQGICIAPPVAAEQPVCSPEANYSRADGGLQHVAADGHGDTGSRGRTSNPTVPQSGLQQYWSSMGAGAPVSTPLVAANASSGQETLAATGPVAPAGAASASPSPDGNTHESHAFRDGALGVAYGTMQGITPGGFLAPSPAPRSRTFEFFRGAGQIATGVAETFLGLGGEALGIGLDSTGVGAIAGVPINVGSAVLAANGVASAGAGLGMLWNAMTRHDPEGGDSPPSTGTREPQAQDSPSSPDRTTPTNATASNAEEAAQTRQASPSPAAEPASPTQANGPTARSIRSLNQRLAEHRAKLEAYRSNPDAFDNNGFLRNAPSVEVRERIIQGRIRHLESEISNFERQIEELSRGTGGQ